MIRKRSETHGFTLTEVAVVLGILGIIMGAIWAAANAVRAKHRTEVGVNHIWQIANGVRDIYKGHPFGGVENDVTATLRGQGVITDDMGENPWGGQYAVTFVNTNQFYIVVRPNGATGWPPSVCVDLFAAIQPVGRGGLGGSPTPVPVPAPNLAGSEQGGMPTNVFFRSGGTGFWVDVTGTDAVMALRAAADCSGVAFYFVI